MIIVYRKPAHTETICPTTDSLTRPHYYMDFLLLITPCRQAINLYFSVFLSVNILLIWNDLPLGSLKAKMIALTHSWEGTYITFWWSIQHFVFLHQRLLSSKHRIGFGFYHRQPNNINIKVSCVKTHDNKFLNSFFLLCLSLQIMPHLLLLFHPHHCHHQYCSRHLHCHHHHL